MIISSILGIITFIALLTDAPLWVFGVIILCLLIEIKVLDIEADYWADHCNTLLDEQVAIVAEAVESSKEYIEYTTKVCNRFSDEEIQLLRSMTEEEYQLFKNWIKLLKDIKEKDDIK